MNEKRTPKLSQVRQEAPRPKLRIVKLEGRIAPATSCPGWVCGTSNYNETLVRDRAATGKPKAAEDRPEKPKLRIVKLEPRIAPKPIPSNHNETLVRDRT